MKVVLDSSVLTVASISRAGVCAELFQDVLAHHESIISDFIVNEVSRKLHEKFDFTKTEIAELCSFLKATGSFVVPAEIDANVCRDPQDIPVLGTAVAGTANLLISVDKDLLAIGPFQGIEIIKPGEFWKKTGT